MGVDGLDEGSRGPDAPSEKKTCEWEADSARGDQVKGDEHSQARGRRLSGEPCRL